METTVTCVKPPSGPLETQDEFSGLLWESVGTTVTCVMMESKLLLIQNRFTVVYSGEWDADGDYCDMWQANQWSTAEVVLVLWTTVTSITRYSKLLGMQNGSSVVYFEEYNAKGDYCEVCQATQLTTLCPRLILSDLPHWV